jgi:K+ transporter
MNDRVIHINLSTVILLCITLVVLFISTKSCDPKSTDFTKQQTQIDSISGVIKQLQLKQHKLDGTLVYHTRNIDSLNHAILNTQQQILDTRLYYDNKIKDINRYTFTQLYSFFANRYK